MVRSSKKIINLDLVLVFLVLKFMFEFNLFQYKCKRSQNLSHKVKDLI